MSSRANKESREKEKLEKADMRMNYKVKRTVRPPATKPNGSLRTRREMIDAVVEEAETGRPKKR